MFVTVRQPFYLQLERFELDISDNALSVKTSSQLCTLLENPFFLELIPGIKELALFSKEIEGNLDISSMLLFLMLLLLLERIPAIEF